MQGVAAYGFRDDGYFILEIKGAFPGELQSNPRRTLLQRCSVTPTWRQ